MIEFKNVCKNYGRKKCLENISFSIDSGEIVGLLGLNGAGKSTTMNLMTGYINPTKGGIFIDGVNIADNPKKAKSKIGYLPEIPPLYGDMTVSEFLRFVCDIKKVKNKKDTLPLLMERTGISDVSGRMIRYLSKGYKQRTGLAAAIAGEPEILVLDEPTVGLDPKQIAEIRELIKEIGKDKTVLISSHILSEISMLCKRVIVIKDGKIAADGSPDDLSGQRRFIISTLTDAESVIRNTDGVTGVKCDGTRYEIEAERDIRCELFYKLAEAKCPIMSLEYKQESLENTFLELVSEEGKE